MNKSAARSKSSSSSVVVHKAAPNTYPESTTSQPIYIMQSPQSRAINVGLIKKGAFVPGRLFLGIPRADATYQATVQTLQLPECQKILKKHKPSSIFTVTLMREALAHRLGDALYHAGIQEHSGDAFVGVTHHKTGGDIKAKREYANTEGLGQGGLWIVADSICMARNLHNVMESLFATYQPDEVIYISSIASRAGIKHLGKLTAAKGIPTTFFAWGALFGVDETTRYDMPWGHHDTEPLDTRDQQVFTKMYSSAICVGGDFGNDYFAPAKARKLYKEQLKQYNVTPKIPSANEIYKIYKKEELLIQDSLVGH